VEKSDSSNNRLVIVSNRLPVIISKKHGQEWESEPGSGGLVTALAPVLKDRGGLWIGWPGNIIEDEVDTETLLKRESKNIGYTLKSVELSRLEVENYYKGFANEILWPLFHDFIAYCNFNPDYWIAYQTVNHKFAEVIAENIQPSDFIWIHDYHLIGVGEELRKMGVKNQIGFFLHIPFPPTDIFVRLPWRFQILHSLLEYDLIGLQSFRERRNFLQAIRTFVQDTRGMGKGPVIKMKVEEKEIRIGVFPISIDFEEFSQLAASQEVSERAWYIHEDYREQKIIFGVDRLDYTKGVPDRLKAYQNALRRYPELCKKTTLIQVVVPSRRDIPQYVTLLEEIERLVGEINGEFTQPGWVPIHYIYRNLDRTELVAYYRMAEVAFITPLKDGMNLVAKEYCSCNLELSGVLIMSEFAGSVAQFQKAALVVNPHDIEGMADTLHRAINLPFNERNWRMKILRASVRKQNIFWWVDSFLEAAISKNLESFPKLEDYTPSQ
jgi:trehalose 6-phosphate synthase/phosphatase